VKDEVNDIRLRVASEVKAHFAPETLSFSAVPPNISPAQSMFKRLQKQILDFEAKLNDDQEIAVRLVSFSDSQVFHIQGMGYHGPDIITFVAVSPEGEHVQLIQHVSQLNVLLIAAKKLGPKPQRIGFV